MAFVVFFCFWYMLTLTLDIISSMISNLQAPMTNYKCLQQHYDAKHPKEKCPGPDEV